MAYHGRKRKTSPLAVAVTLILAAVCFAACGILLPRLALSAGTQKPASGSESAGVEIMNKLDMYVTNRMAGALEGLEGVEVIRKEYWLSDSDIVAPKPNPDNYGTATDPAELAWLNERAVELFGGRELLFNEDTPVWSGDKIYYYLDETILVVTWKQVIDGGTYTFSEVKIAHPSQFRRFLAGGEFGSDKQYVTTEMAASVNAVVASSADFYKFRHYGAVVYQGQLQRFEGNNVDTCFIDDKGDLLFQYRGDMKSEEDAKRFIEENNIRFSLAFGPVMIEDGVNKVPSSYAIGEINNNYTRAAICQMGQLHYLLVNAGQEGENVRRQPLKNFTDNLIAMGVPRAYALDGGQTAVISMDGKLISRPDYGTQRQISDIIYFATALPDGG